MLLQRLLCLFAPGLPGRQVAPFDKENEDEIMSSARLMMKSFKKKFNTDTNGAKSVNNERDCISLVECIKTVEHEGVYEVFADPTRTIIVSFCTGDQTAATIFRGKNPLILSQLRMLAGKTILRDIGRESTASDLRILVDVISGFVDLSQRLQRSLHRRHEINPLSNICKYQSGSLTHDGSAVLTNLLLVAILDYISTPKSPNMKPICAGFYSCFERLCLSLKVLCVSAPVDSSAKTKLLYCQCISTASKIIPSLGFQYAGNQIAMPTDNQIRHLASILQILAFSLIAVRKFCGEESYGATMLYWSACDALPCILDMAATSSKVQANISTQSKTSASMIFQALSLTCPAPQELEDEIRRLQRSRSLDIPSSMSTMDMSSMPPTRMGSYSQSASCRVGGLPELRVPCTAADFTNVFSPFRVLYQLEGLQRVLRAGILDIGNSGSVMRLREEWLTCFARTLLFVLDQLPQPFMSINSTLVSGKCGNAISMIEFAPVLAEMFLEISMSFDFSSTREFDWIYTDLSKRLGVFVDQLRLSKKVAQKQMMRKRASLPLKGSADMTSIPSAASTLREMQASHLDESGQLVFPLWPLKPQFPIYAVEDAVDGQHSLSNGTQRWYPGRITAAHSDGTYSLTYLDGDVHTNKDPSEIRPTKNSKLSSLRSSRSGLSSNEGGSLRNSFLTVNSDVLHLSAPPLHSPFKSAPARKRSMTNSTHRLLGVVEHSEGCSTPPGRSMEGSRDTNCVLLLPTEVVRSQLPITGMSTVTDDTKATTFEERTITSTFNYRVQDDTDSVKSNFSDISVHSVDSNESCEQTFEIQSVFDTPRQELKIDATRIELVNLELSSAASQCSGMSLSAFLCRDNGDSIVGDGEDELYDSCIDGSSTFPSPKNNITDWPTQVFGSNTLQIPRSRIGKECSIPQSYSPIGHGHPAKPLNVGGPCDALLAASYEVYRASYAGSPTSDRHSERHSSNGYGSDSASKPQRKCSSFCASGIADRGLENVRVSSTMDSTFATSLRAYGIVSAILIQHCIVGKGNFLDINSCSTSDPDTATSLRIPCDKQQKDENVKRFGLPLAALPPLGKDLTHSKQVKQINILFSVREFLEKITDSERRAAIPFLTEISNFSIGASMRVLKLVSPSMFKSCLPGHMSSAKKIGDGGFGSVFRVTCDNSCRNCGTWESNTRRNPVDLPSGEKKLKKSSTTLLNARAHGHGHGQSEDIFPPHRATGRRSSTSKRTAYAVKRIPRERSMHDSPMIYEVFNEITCLQLLAGCRGVCQLIDFGVHGMEYWIVLEAGTMDLRAWRHSTKFRNNVRGVDKKSKARTQPTGRLPTTSNLTDIMAGEGEQTSFDDVTNARRVDATAPLSLDVESLAMCLALYADALLIVQSVHALHVLHFDIKCNNFILHSEPDLNTMLKAHANGVPSGFLFLADFGESVPSLSSADASADACQAGGEVSILQRSVPGRGPSSLSRSRGTLPIQSPEMLSLTAAGGARSSFQVPITRMKTASKMTGKSSHSDSRTGDKSTEHSSSKKLFAPPCAASDVWSLGCLLVELITGDYLMKNRPWTDLYVSLCMSHFCSPSLDDFRQALSTVNFAPGCIRVLEGIIAKCLCQDPAERAPIVDLYDDIASLISNEECDSVYTESSLRSAGPLTSASLITATDSIKLDASQKSWNILSWNNTFTKLRPRSLDFRGGCGLMITLLSASESFTHDYDPGVIANMTVRRNVEEATEHWTSTGELSAHLFTSYPYVNMDTLSSQGSSSGEDLKRRFDVVSDHINTCTLASCAKSLAFKSVTTSARTRGLLHIEISCRGVLQYRQGEGRGHGRESLGGVEHLVLPFGELKNTTSSSSSSRSNSSNDGRDRCCDAEVIKSIERLLHRAQAALSVEKPPCVLITIVPTPSVQINFEADAGEEKENCCAHLSPTLETRKSKRFPDCSKSNESNDHGSVAFLEVENKDDTVSEEDELSCPLNNYSCVALTVASMIANSLTDYMTATATHRSKGDPSSSSHTRHQRDRTSCKEKESNKSSALGPIVTSIDRKSSRNHLKPTDSRLPVSQRVVAPWLQRSLHSEFKTFLSQQIDSPPSIAQASKSRD